MHKMPFKLAFLIFLKSVCMLSSKLQKMTVYKFKFPFKFTDRFKKQSATTFVEEPDVKKEYLEVFRTKSYIDICDKVQGHLDLDNESSSSSSSIRDQYILQHEILPDPLAKTFDIHCILHDFIDAGLESWDMCEKLLHSVHQANENRNCIERIIKLAEMVPKSDQRTTIYKELAFYNPLSDFSLEKFPKIHNDLNLLLKKLTTNQARIKRKRRFIKCLKKSLGFGIVVSYTVLAAAFLVLAFHGLVGIVASPSLIAYSLSGLTKKGKAAKKGPKKSKLKRVGLLLDVAAKGIYTMIKDFDTIGSLAGRLHNEVEFRRAAVRICFENLKPDVIEEIMREFRVHESRFMEQLEEFKNHIYLCLLNINRSRRFMVKEVMPCSYKGII